MVLVDSKRPFIIIATILIAAFFGIMIYQQYQKFLEKNSVTIYTGIGQVKIRIEYAQTPEKQKQGLAERALLDKNSGMLFVFPDEKVREFWMKDTLIPLDIIFISTNGRINEIITMKPCAPDASTCPTYTSKESARFAIEVNAGFSQKNKIIEGDILEISGF